MTSDAADADNVVHDADATLGAEQRQALEQPLRTVLASLSPGARE